MFLGIQIILIAFILFMLYVVHIHNRKGELPKPEALFWYVSLIALGFFVILPQSANFLVRTFSVTRLTDLVVIVALMITFVFLIENRIQINKMRQKLERIVRENAVKTTKKK